MNFIDSEDFYYSFKYRHNEIMLFKQIKKAHVFNYIVPKTSLK